MACIIAISDVTRVQLVFPDIGTTARKRWTGRWTLQFNHKCEPLAPRQLPVTKSL